VPAPEVQNTSSLEWSEAEPQPGPNSLNLWNLCNLWFVPISEFRFIFVAFTDEPAARCFFLACFSDAAITVMHVSTDDAAMVKIGTLPSGGECIVNRVAVEADLLLAEGFIESHFFAGFSGGRKSVLPGIYSYKTIMANHCSEFIGSKLHCAARDSSFLTNPRKKFFSVSVKSL
jgi:Lactate racemase N-terminal domain